MRRLFWTLALVALLAVFLPVADTSVGRGIPTASAQQILDDEMVVLLSNGRIVVYDPNLPPGAPEEPWQSPDGGWQDVATGDFNGDGDDEILAIRGGEAKVFDPVVPPGSVPVVFSVVVSGQSWRRLATGDVNGDGRDEIILTRTTSEGTIIERMQAYYGNATGTSWTLVFNEGFGTEWKRLTTGDANNDGIADVAAIRNKDNPRDYRITIWNPISNWSTLYDNGSFSFPWQAIEIGNGVAGGGNEILLTRSGVQATLDSFLIFRLKGSSLDDVRGSKFNPHFDHIALGNTNNSDADQIFLLRNTSGSSSVSLIARYYGSGAVVPFETLPNSSKYKRILTGDFDGDGRAELAVMSASDYRIYTSPAANLNFDVYPGNYISSGNFAVGDIDGAKPTEPTLTLTPSSLDLELESGQGANQTISVINSGTDTPIGWTASVTQGSSWLSVLTPAGSTPGTLRVGVNAIGLAEGTYVGKVRVTATAPDVQNSPADFTLNLTVKAPPFAATPSSLSWFLTVGDPVSSKQVLVLGPNVPWNAGLVPLDSVPTLQQALAEEGASVQRTQDRFIITSNAGVTEVPIVDWYDIVPTSGTSSPVGSAVLVTPIVSKLPPGFSAVALVFVADAVASPRAVVVDLSTLVYDPSVHDLFWMPLITR